MINQLSVASVENIAYSHAAYSWILSLLLFGGGETGLLTPTSRIIYLDYTMQNH